MRFSPRVKGLLFDVLPGPVRRPIQKWHCRRKLKALTEYSERDFIPIKFLVEGGDHVIDIGADFGIYTYYLSDLVGDWGRVYSLESDPATFDLLSANVKKLDLDNVRPIACVPARSLDSLWAEGLLTEIPRDAAGNLWLPPVLVREMDDGAYPAITFIKCAADGNGLSAVRGATRLNEKYRPAWLLAVAGDPDEDGSAAWQTFALLRQSRYEAYWFDGGELRRRQPGDHSASYFFLTRDQVELVQLRGLDVREGG